MKAWKVALAGLMVILLPVLAVFGLGLIVVSLSGAAAAGGKCVPAAGANNASITTDTLVLTTTSGASTTLEAKQLQNASQSLATARQLGVNEKAIKVMVIMMLQESKFWIYANTNVPESLQYPHDKVGSDHDSVGTAQQRPNWGTVAERMDLAYAVKAFMGGPNGPNGGSPAGLLDIAGWETMTLGQAAQAVQVSAYPDAYDQWIPAADTLISALGGGGSEASCPSGNAGTGNAVYPLDQPYSMTDGYGPRSCPVGGSDGCAASTWHPALDLAPAGVACGKPVYAMMAGTVSLSSTLYLSITSPDGYTISYLHTYKSERNVDVGAQVKAGDPIALVGNVAPSTGCHLDIRVEVSGNTNPQVAALPTETRSGGTWVNPEDFLNLFGLAVCPPDWCSRNF